MQEANKIIKAASCLLWKFIDLFWLLGASSLLVARGARFELRTCSRAARLRHRLRVAVAVDAAAHLCGGRLPVHLAGGAPVAGARATGEAVIGRKTLGRKVVRNN